MNPEAPSGLYPHLDLEVIERLIDLSSDPSGNIGDDSGFFGEMIALFVETAPGIIKDIESAITRNDITNLTHHAHRLKGVCYNMGARLMGDYCAHLEENAKNGLAPKVSDAMDELGESFTASHSQLVAAAKARLNIKLSA